MPVTLESVYADAMSLPDDAKQELVERLVTELQAEVDPELEQLHIEDAKRRRDAMRAGAVQSVPGPEALKLARAAIIR